MATTSARPFLSGIVLAAGASTRMGTPKQLLPLAGRPLLAHALAAAADSRLDEIVLVLGSAAAEILAAVALPARVRAITVPDPGAGQSASLRAGLRAAAAHADAAAVLLGDQPRVSAALIDEVARAFLAGGRPAARPVWTDGHGAPVPGHPVFLARALWPEAERLTGDAGARALFAARPERLLEVRLAGEPPADVDDWHDYRRAAGARPPPALVQEE
jgi:molybdenum cofactor cytidylyltransferase